MTNRLHGVDIDALDTAAQQLFWSRLLESPPAGESAVELGPGTLRFVAAAHPKSAKNRLHLDLASTSAGHQIEIVDRARGLGAVPVDVGQRDVPWVVLADPEGNEFCVLEPRDEYLGLGPVAAVVIDALDPAAQARFWSGATGLEIARAGDVVASLRQDGAYFVEFIRVPTATAGPNRVRLRVQGPVAPTDPEGNEITAE
ncbi:VOC family protein [Mycobacterium sp. 852013-51886_SCH5428379]|uniref:VOC family protein n=1 Tax=Mycobacteriaceae TaxID=1762 RepID=UPI0009EE6EE8|nr:VOC family protein [Mycobacterium sp. 852013-51886_SCH5428379]MCK0177306.1 VOC family protein [Mycolicibacterium sp. F2034L]